MCFHIECKTAHDKPWIIFVSKSQPERFIPFDIVATNAYKSHLLESFKESEFRSLVYSAPLLKPYIAGHGLTQAFTSGQDVPYKAVMSSVKASVDRIINFHDLQKKEAPDKKPKMWAI